MNSLSKQLKQIKSGNFQPVYLVQGTETYLIEKVKKTFMDAVFQGEDASLNFGQFSMTENLVDQAIQEAESFPFFGDWRLVFIQDPYFLTAEKPKNDLDHDLNLFKDYVSNPSDFSILVIFANYEKMDKRKKINKTLLNHAEVLDVSPMKEGDLKKYIQAYCQNKDFTFEPGALELLLERTNYQLTTLMSELDKLMLFHTDDRKISQESVNQLVTRSLESNVFSINDFVLNGQVQPAIQAFNDLLKQKEEPIKIIAIMMSQYRLLLQVKILRSKGYQQNDIAQALKVHPYRVKLAMQKERIFTQGLLSAAYRKLIEADYNIKSGKMDSNLQFELFVMQFSDSIKN